MVAFIDDQHADADLVCATVRRPASLLLLVRADPAQFAVRLSPVSPGKNGRVAAENRRDLTRSGVGSFGVSDVEISEISSRRERDAFIKFPWRIYADDPAWVPPLIIERRAFLDRKRHPFYRHGDAALFLASRGRGSQIVGRIMASDDPNYNALHQSNVGCFGLFECIDDRDVALAL